MDLLTVANMFQKSFYMNEIHSFEKSDQSWTKFKFESVPFRDISIAGRER